MQYCKRRKRRTRVFGYAQQTYCGWCDYRVHSLDVEEYRQEFISRLSLDRYLSEDIPAVAVNHKEGWKFAAEELIRCGCKSVLHFCGSKAIESPYHDRHSEFERIMKKNGVRVQSYELEWNRFDADYYEKVMKDIFSNPFKKVDGVFGVDQIAIRFLNEAKRREYICSRKISRLSLTMEHL